MNLLLYRLCDALKFVLLLPQLLHLFVLVKIDLLNDHEIVPVDIFGHFRVLDGFLVSCFRFLHGIFVHLSLFASLLYRLLLLNEPSVAIQSLILGEQNSRVPLNKTGEVAEETMSGLQEVELWILRLFLCQTLEELLSILGDKLGCKFDRVHINWCYWRMSDLEEIRRGSFDLNLLGLLLLNKDLLSKHILKLVFTAGLTTFVVLLLFNLTIFFHFCFTVFLNTILAGVL